MKEKNNPPFYVGQKVVALVNVIKGPKKGKIVTVDGVKKDCCGEWIISFGYAFPGKIQCHICKGFISTGGVNWEVAENFAPVDEPRERIRYVAVSESLREKAQEVMADSVTTN